MAVSSDPYEQKLYQMFKEHDRDATGSLDRDALINLCKSLELKDRGNGLAEQLFLSGGGQQQQQQQRVTFIAFKEALLNFLGSEMKHTEPQSESETKYSCGGIESPGREVSPKFVVGSKKYGRRSRPQDDVIHSSSSESDNESSDGDGHKSSKITRSSSHSDIRGSKRRRGVVESRLKRCASLPAQKPPKETISRSTPKTHLESSVESLGNLDFENLSESLYEVWASFGDVDTDEIYLDQSQLQKVCERVGLRKIANKVAEEVFDKLKLNANSRISFNDFISLIQCDTTVATSAPSDVMSVRRGVDLHLADDDCCSASRLTDIEQDSGCNIGGSPTSDRGLMHDTAAEWASDLNVVPLEVIVEMWESVGITQPKSLLMNLGFTEKEIQLSQLSLALEEELSSVNPDESISSILRASLVLHKTEVNTLRQSLKQMTVDNRKLHADNREINRRAALLAQEIDERHASLENSTRTEIRTLEQRHAESVRDLTAQFAGEKEHWSSVKNKLEQRLKSFEVEENKYKNEINLLQEENTLLEQEQNSLSKQITDLLETNIKLNNEICGLEDKYTRVEGYNGEKETEEVLELIDKITTLQLENANLRDKNDELASEIDELHIDLAKARARKQQTAKMNEADSGETETSTSTDSGVTAMKRRGDSPSKTRMPEESPRLGKVRKCSNDNSGAESETSGDWIALNSEMNQSLSTGTAGGGATSSGGFSQEFSSLSKDDEIKHLKQRVAELEGNKSSGNSETAGNEVSKLTVQIEDLEGSLEQMRKEYENCEDYWQSKLTEERILYEEEKRVSDEKFDDLYKKMAEYEEQFAINVKDGRLSPIEEKCHLEQQYTELEIEIEEIKTTARKILDDKSQEIAVLRAQVMELQLRLGDVVDAPPILPQSNDINSPASSPISYLWSQSTIQAPARDYQNPNWQTQALEKSQQSKLSTSIVTIVSTTDSVNWNDEKAAEDSRPVSRAITPIQKPASPFTAAPKEPSENGDAQSGKSHDSHSVASTHSIHPSAFLDQVNPGVLREDIKRLKFIEFELQDELKTLAHQRDCLVMECQQLQEVKPVLEKAYMKIQQLELKNRHLQNIIRQQQQYNENIMHQTWQQQQNEVSELRNRLEAQASIIAEQATRLGNADLLVKDLYVENSHLSATIQRLEQQRTRINMMNMTHGGMNGVPGIP